MMKKRIVALLLVLVLSMAMMVPVFAATVEPRACSHNYVPSSYSSWVLVVYDSGYHAYQRTRTDVCTRCAAIRTESEYTGMDKHDFSLGRNCRVCGYTQGS